MNQEQEQTLVDRPCGLYQEYVRGQIKKIVLSEEILVNILVDWYGQPTFVRQNWEEYWTPITSQLPPEGLKLLDDLKIARKQYIASEFSHETMVRYCFRYFCLLEEILRGLENVYNKNATPALLRKVLGFENFTIRWADGSIGLACGTSTIRNPCYLLAKIKQPQAYDDPKFLAIITDTDITSEARLFYHYRQYKIDDEFRISLLLYPAVDLSQRADSFTLIESLTLGLSSKSDPRSKKRSEVLADSVISPFLSKMFSKVNPDSAQEIKFVDIGSGNGALASNIWRQMLKTQSDVGRNCKLACSMVGLRVQDPLRHFNKKGSLRGTISYLDYSQTDYLHWIQKQKITKENFKFDIALICRLLNNLSTFKLDSSNNWQIIHKLGEEGLSKADWLNRKFEPHNCLSPNYFSPKNILLKNSNVLLKKGKSFRHLSLSNYYKGLQLLHSNNALNEGTANAIHFPIRQFNSGCLQLSKGNSFLDKLCNLAKLVVIEDVDLTEKILIEHLIEHNLENISVSHVNKHNRINSAQVFCLCNTKFEDFLSGKRIWPNSLKKIENLMYLRLRNSAVFQKYQLST
jgi:hypothetical protein